MTAGSCCATLGFLSFKFSLFLSGCLTHNTRQACRERWGALCMSNTNAVSNVANLYLCFVASWSLQQYKQPRILFLPCLSGCCWSVNPEKPRYFISCMYSILQKVKFHLHTVESLVFLSFKKAGCSSNVLEVQRGKLLRTAASDHCHERHNTSLLDEFSLNLTQIFIVPRWWTIMAWVILTFPLWCHQQLKIFLLPLSQHLLNELAQNSCLTNDKL